MNWGDPDKRPVFTCDRCGVKTTASNIIYWETVCDKRLCWGCARQFRATFKRFMKEGKKDVNI